MKKLLVPGVFFLCSLVVFAVIVVFRSGISDALGKWLEPIDSIIPLFVSLSLLWLLFRIAQTGREGSRLLPNNDRMAGYRIGLPIILGAWAGLMLLVTLLFAGAFDQVRSTSGGSAFTLLSLTAFSVTALFSFCAAWAWRSRQIWNAEEIKYRGVFGWNKSPWSDLRRIEHGFQDGRVTFHFADRKKLSVFGTYHEAAGELVEFAQEKIARVQLPKTSGTARTKGKVTTRTPTRILLLLLVMSMIGVTGYVFWNNSFAVSGRMTAANAVWLVLTTGAGLYLLYFAWLMKGPHYLWDEQYLVHFDRWKRSILTPWADLQSLELDHEDTASRVLGFSGNLKLKIHHRLKGADDLIAFAESRLNDARTPRS
ncbi:hypothetical protein [Ruegeria sp. PrR005]|uniref:Uncharacterized protein n=1 Tax=Ruegeria sp. PrR005 TaxID=2706882 RepID=A0A6B2NRZ5_9RHOB|nr:hypothetical protein [Ruegeria sp. PrR005]NDW45960.1 hypothetical protein [Ruegeria sp. PrR005]